MRHEARLDRLAKIAVYVGLGLKRNQEVVVMAPIEALPLVRQITEHAYRAGASLVSTLFTDEEATLMRFRHATEDSFDKAPDWLFDGMSAAHRDGAARLAIVGQDPFLLVGQDPDKVARADRARSRASAPARRLLASFATNWTVVPYVTTGWAGAVFPKERREIALAKLWEAVFAACRVDAPDPVLAWAEQTRYLQARASFLNAKRYAALHFRGAGTDLLVGLADDHEWLGGSVVTTSGTICSPNIPTEEVYTAPHKDRVRGRVTSTKPISYQGILIEELTIDFEDGRIVDAQAKTGEVVLRKLLETDEGSHHLGEIALVPYSSPISKANLLFYNTLFDENAASHLAIGQALNKCIRGGEATSKEELSAKGANRSSIHLDFMIGSAGMDVDGLTTDEDLEPLMRQGEWVC